jgi:hypothetical protein
MNEFNMKKFLIWIVILFLLFILIVVLFLSTLLKKRENLGKGKVNTLYQETTKPTITTLNGQRPSVATTKNPQINKLSKLKNELLNGYKFEGIILDYQSKSDFIFVYYNGSIEEAKKRVKKFFEIEGVDNASDINISYISLDKDLNKPPAGFFVK